MEAKRSNGSAGESRLWGCTTFQADKAVVWWLGGSRRLVGAVVEPAEVQSRRRRVARAH